MLAGMIDLDMRPKKIIMKVKMFIHKSKKKSKMNSPKSNSKIKTCLSSSNPPTYTKHNVTLKQTVTN